MDGPQLDLRILGLYLIL